MGEVKVAGYDNVYDLSEYRAQKYAKEHPEEASATEEFDNWMVFMSDTARKDQPCIADTILVMHGDNGIELKDEGCHMLTQMADCFIYDSEEFIIELLNNLLAYNPNKIRSYLHMEHANKIMKAIWPDTLTSEEFLIPVDGPTDEGVEKTEESAEAPNDTKTPELN